jgi:hypothetical protein
MSDERLLLLVDGLDEYRSESAAGLARRQMQVFVEMRNCPTIVTSRPVGYQRLTALSGEWATGTLAEFSTGQQRAFATSWMQFRLANSIEGTDERAISQRTIAEVERFEAEIARSHGLQELAGIPLLLGILIYLNSSSVPLPQTRFQAYRHGGPSDRRPPTRKATGSVRQRRCIGF